MNDNEKKNRVQDEETTVEPVHNPPAKRFIKLKPFSFVMLVFGLVLFTAGITFFVLTAGNDKVVEVVKPQPNKTDRTEFQKLYEAYDEMNLNYFEDIDQAAVIDGAINGMVDALKDPYSDYLNEEEARQLNESISSSFEGIGAEIKEQDGYIAVVSPIKNSPAERAGILPNDKISAVDGKSIQGMSSSEAVLLIRGEKGTTVALTILRGNNEPMTVKVVRDVIPLETVYHELDEDGIGHVRITSFSTGTYDELIAALDDMEANGLKALIVDVRQNPGGILNGAADIADLFIEKGKNLFQYESKGKKPDVYPATGGRKVEVPVTVVIDDGSASASEILAGALSESADIKLVGVTTFGKGTVQSPQDLPDGSNLKLTTAKWLTPNGNWIHEKGIKPDVEVPYPSYAMLPFLDPAVEMKEGLVSPAVKSAEEMLDAVGYEPGEVDGLFDRATVGAVKKLQTDLELESTGILTGDTTLGLMNKLREKIEQDDPQLRKAKELLLEKLAQ